MEGLFIRRLITFRLRSRDPFHIVVWVLAVLFLLSPLSLPLVALLTAGYVMPLACCYSSVPGLIGVLLLANLALNGAEHRMRSRRQS
jgi:hypothetical protein